MMQITHASTGAAVGKFIPNPLIAFIVGIIIHFVVDRIPHLWPETKRGKMILVVLDHTITYTIFLACWYFKIGTASMIAGAAGSLLVDIVIIAIPQIYKGPIGKWHTERQPHHSELIWVLTDALVTAMALMVLILV
jgi:hypothetical protein